MEKTFVSNKGITIITLIITIIILLILAGIMITQITGENTLISMVNQAKKIQIKAEMKENLELIISELKIEKAGKATINDITEEFLKEKINNYEIIKIETMSTNNRKIKMQKDGTIGSFLIDEELNVTEVKDGDNIEFSYDKLNRVGEKIKILIHIQDKENGIERIELMEEDAIIANGIKEEIGIDYEVEIGKEYKIIITSTNGDVIEKIILIEPEIEVTEPIIGTTETATSSVEDNSQTKGTKLYINFNAKLEGTECNIVNREDNLTVPYEIESNGKYTFIITGTYKGRIITKEIEIQVNKYMHAKGIVKYDAGNWTKEEINELKNMKIYDINSNHENNNIPKLKNEEGWNFTFGGFTYEGDNENEKEIQEGRVITSRNQSVNPQYGAGINYYDGWQIFESEEKEVNGKIKTYVTKIIHAGAPENFVYSNYTNGYDAFAASYLLTGNMEYTNNGKVNFDDGNPIPVRNWNMYKDIHQLELIKEVHCLTLEEGATGVAADIINLRIPIIEASVWVPGHYTLEYWRGTYLHAMKKDGSLNYSDSGLALGIRPVVSFVEGVYIDDGNGTAANPFVLKKD